MSNISIRGIHVVSTNRKWSVRQSGSARASGIYDTQEEAIEQGQKIAENLKAVLYIHDRGGRIRERITRHSTLDPFVGL